MNDLRKAAEMALKQLQRDDVYLGHRSKTRADAITALRQTLDLQTAIERGTKAWADVPADWVEDLRGNTPPCKTHPDAPHGFDRNASHSADRYVCECEGWEPVDAVNMSQDRVDETAKGEHEPQKRSFNEDVGRLLSTGKGIYDDGTPIDPKEIQMKIEGVGEGVVVCTEVHLPRPPKRDSSSWVGLTDKEWYMIWRHSTNLKNAIEEKLREKNT